MKKILVFVLGAMLTFGAVSCNNSNKKNQPAEVESVEVVDSLDVQEDTLDVQEDTLAIGAVTSEEEVAL